LTYRAKLISTLNLIELYICMYLSHITSIESYSK